MLRRPVPDALLETGWRAGRVGQSTETSAKAGVISWETEDGGLELTVRTEGVRMLRFWTYFGS